MNSRTLTLISASLALILCAAAAQRDAAPKTRTISTRADLAKTIAELQADQNALDSSHRAYVANAEKLLRQYALLAKRAEEVATTAGGAKSGNADSASLQAAIQRMHETQMSFNLQYLQLLLKGGSVNVLGNDFKVLGLQRIGQITRAARRQLPARSPVRRQLDQVIRFNDLAQQNFDKRGSLTWNR